MKKRYLVACYDQNDCIEMMQKIYLQMAMCPDQSRIFRQKRNEMMIVSTDMAILFRDKREVSQMCGEFFFGMKTSLRYQQLVSFDVKEDFEKMYQRSIRLYGLLDRERFLDNLIKKAGEKNGLFEKLAKPSKQ